MDNRPKHLKENSYKVVSNNDVAIKAALKKLNSLALSGEIKPTISSLAKLAGVSDGTINGRGWALVKLKKIKKMVSSNNIKKSDVYENKPDENKILKDKIEGLINQNVLLYDEVLCLQEKIKRLEKENEALKRRINLKAVR